MAASHHRVRSSGAAGPVLARWARRLGAAAAAGVAGVALYGPAPVRAQLPELFPTSSTTASPTTAPASESTILPPLEKVAPPSTAPPGGTSTTPLLPLPTATPGTTLLPGPRTSRTTTFDTLPIPPRTRARVTTTTLQGSTRASTLPPVEDREGGDEEGSFEEALPFTPEDEQIRAAGLDTELGGDGSQDPVRLMASVAAGLIALVLLGLVSWLQSQVRGRPHLW